MKITKKLLINSLITSTPFAGSLLRSYHRIKFSNHLLILTYHLVVDSEPDLPDWCALPVSLFEEQMHYLARHFQVMNLAEGIRTVGINGQTSKPVAVITFDDGFYNNYSLAFPILSRLRLPATIFLASGLIDTDNSVWFCQLHRALDQTSAGELRWGGEVFNISTPADKAATYRILQVRLKRFPHHQLLDGLTDIGETLGYDPASAIEQSSIHRMLDENSIRQMAKSGLIEFGAHTRDHVILSRLSRDEQRWQIRKSLSEVRAMTGQSEVPFAFPNGAGSDYNTESLNELKQAGVNYSVTMIPGMNHAGTDPLQLKRIGVGNGWHKGIFMIGIHTGKTRGL